MNLLGFIFMSAVAVISDGFIVHSPSDLVVVSLGSSVVLPCYVDEPLPVKGLEVQWRRTDSETLVHLYQDGESRPEVQQQDYQYRAHFFTDQIQHGNFSLRLDNLRAEDEGKYTCKVYSQQDSGETEVQIKDVERVLVSGSNRSISASVGDDVTLYCSVDSHIKPEHIEEVSWRKTDKDKDILVLLYLNNETLPDSSDDQYRDRVEFFTDEIPKGNFSIRLKSVNTKDKGVYICHVFAGRLSAKTTVVLERLGFSNSHIMVLMLCVAASGSALLPCIIIYCISQNTDSTTKHVRTLGFLHVFLPNIMMFVAFVLWGVIEAYLYETIFCCALYILRPLMVISVAPYLKKIPDLCLLSEFVIFTLVGFGVFFNHIWINIIPYEESEKMRMISLLGGVILLCVIFIIYLFTENLRMPCRGEKCKMIWEKVTHVAVFSFLILPSLLFSFLLTTFGERIVSMIFPMFFFLSYSCGVAINKEKSSLNVLNITSWLISMLVMTAGMVYFYSPSLKYGIVSAEAAGWTCTAVFLQVLWMIAINIKNLELTLTFKKILYVFGSVVVVLLNSVTLMTELILKMGNGERAVGDLRDVVFSSESIFAFSFLILSMFGPWISDINCRQCCQRAERTEGIPLTGLNQDQDSQTAAASDEASASGSNQNQNSSAESHEMCPLLNQDQEAGRSN